MYQKERSDVIFKQFSKTGAGHLRCRGENQDQVLYLARDGVEGIALADGAGSARFGRLGAREACRAALEYVLHHFQQLYERMEANAIRYEVLHAVQTELDRMAGALDLKGRKELGSTLLLLCWEPAGGRYLCLHVGDGLVGCVHQSQCITISSPVNGITSCFTTLTTSSDCLLRCRVFRGVRQGAVFFLMSDGCTRYLREGDRFLPGAEARILQQDWAGLEAELDRQTPEDDYSFIALAPR